MKRQYFNINNSAWVKLTPLAHEIYKKFWAEALKGSSMSLAAPVLHTDGRGWTEFQLWDLMCIFGHHLYNGAPLVFEMNAIRFNKDDFTTKEPEKPKK